MFMEQVHIQLWSWMNAFFQDTVMQKYILHKKSQPDRTKVKTTAFLLEENQQL